MEVVGSVTGHDMTNSPAQRSKIEDVAERAGVSVATVSRALRGLPNVAESTRRHVTDVAASMNYRADPAAARLAAGRTKTMMAVVPSISGWYFSTIVAGAGAVCVDAGYDFLVVGVGTLGEWGHLLEPTYHLERRTDGVIVVDIEVTDAQFASLHRHQLSLATIGTRRPDCPSVLIDDVGVGRMAADHLIGLGHRRIGLIGGAEDDLMRFQVPLRRRQGFVERLEAAGHDFDQELAAPGYFTVDGGREAMASLLDLDRPPTACFAMSDEMAFGALMALRERGLRPGRDVSVVGVDDHEFASVVELTTVRQMVAHQGASAARALIGEMEAGPDEQRNMAHPVIEEPFELVVRGTTCPHPTGHG